MLFVFYFATSTIFYVPEEERDSLSNGWVRYWLTSFSWTPPAGHPVLVRLREVFEPAGGRCAFFLYIAGHVMRLNAEDITTISIPELDGILARVAHGEVELARLEEDPVMESESSVDGGESLSWSPTDFRANAPDDIFDVSTEAWSSGGEEDDDGSGDERDVEE